MKKIILASEALTLSEVSTANHQKKLKAEMDEAWKEQLKIIHNDLDDFIDKVSEIIIKNANDTAYSISLIISKYDLKYADSFNFYNHFQYRDYTKEMMNELIDKILDSLCNAGYRYHLEYNKPVSISPRLQLNNNEDYISINIEWFEFEEDFYD